MVRSHSETRLSSQFLAPSQTLQPGDGEKGGELPDVIGNVVGIGEV